MEEHAGPIVKGKRTKRQRPQSPIPFEVAASSPTTATSSAELFSSTTEEEEDMANCLILLAQGHEYRKPKRPAVEMEDHNYRRKNNCNNNYYDEPVASPKFTSRRYLETATSTGTRAGYYVYQCKTCNRTFPSFQALGGHRASHKKPKNSLNNNNHRHGSNNFESLALPSPSSTEKRQMLTLLPSSSDDEGQYRKFSSLSLQLGSHNVGSSSFFGNSNNLKNGNSSNSKVHECSICGAEFTSGQALGGHMRRHRATPIGVSNLNAVPSSAGTMTTLSLTPLATYEDLEEPPPSTPVPIDQAKVNNLSLELDLNLPASAQEHHFDHHRHRADHQESCGLSKFPPLMNPPPPPPSSSSPHQQIEQKSQSSNKSSVVFSASPALVDCHY
ncbi:hypothetical protein CRG98_044726 [Punica granatum]|nr:hypothetical protein CRG98_044726 [Punica granatum]